MKYELGYAFFTYNGPNHLVRRATRKTLCGRDVTSGTCVWSHLSYTDGEVCKTCARISRHRKG